MLWIRTGLLLPYIFVFSHILMGLFGGNGEGKDMVVIILKSAFSSLTPAILGTTPPSRRAGTREGGDGGVGTPPSSRGGELAASTQSPPSFLFALGVDVCVFVFSCLCVFRETPLTLLAAQMGRWIADPS